MKLIIAFLFAVAPFANAQSTFTGNSIADMDAFIAANGITTLQDLLPKLSADFRSNFVLMRQSASLQPTKDPLQPRAIMFAPDGNLFLAFNHVSNSLEMIEKQPGTTDFHFERLNFTGTGTPTQQTNCNGCHNGHPLWGQYRSWKGMYGGDQEMVPTGSPEEQDYFQFVKAAQSDTLYSQLIFKCGVVYNGGLVPGFVPEDPSDPQHVTCTDVQTLLANGTTDAARLQRQLDQPGEAMGRLLSRQNAGRLMARIQSSTRYASLKYAYAANSLGCLGDKVYDYSSDPTTMTRVRAALAPLAGPLESKIRALAVANNSSEPSLQGQILNLWGIDLVGDLRLDIRHDTGQPLGNDCEVSPTYSPNSNCVAGRVGYEAYHDGFDMQTDLIGYLVLKDIAMNDTSVRTQLQQSLQMLESYLQGESSSVTGYWNQQNSLEWLMPVLLNLPMTNSTPADIPAYIENYPFTQIMSQGDGLALCRTLLSETSL